MTDDARDIRGNPRLSIDEAKRRGSNEDLLSSFGPDKPFVNRFEGRVMRPGASESGLQRREREGSGFGSKQGGTS
jgi:hypothetical protein